MVLRVKDKEYSFSATMKKIVNINKDLKVGNLRDSFFKAMSEMNFEFLAKMLMALADDETKKIFNNDYNKVYDLMELWVKENNTQENPVDYQTLFEKVADEINDKSFFGKKMSKEDLKIQMSNPLATFDINKVMNQAMENVVGEVVETELKNQEFKGYEG